MKTIIDGHLDLSWNALSHGIADITTSSWICLKTKASGGWTITHAAPCLCAPTSLPEMRRWWHRGLPGDPVGAGQIRVCGFMAAPASLGSTSPTRRSLRRSRKGSSLITSCSSDRGHLRMIRTASDLDAHWSNWAINSASTPGPIGYILAMEGADPIVDVGHAATWWELGLRSVNLVHYGKSRYAVGTGDDGPLTPDGIELLKEFAALGMILDVTHLSDTSFSQAADRFDGPVPASHNNCRALVSHQRQFSDEQIKRLIDQRRL